MTRIAGRCICLLQMVLLGHYRFLIHASIMVIMFIFFLKYSKIVEHFLRYCMGCFSTMLISNGRKSGVLILLIEKKAGMPPSCHVCYKNLSVTGMEGYGNINDKIIFISVHKGVCRAMYI